MGWINFIRIYFGRGIRSHFSLLKPILNPLKIEVKNGFLMNLDLWYFLNGQIHSMNTIYL